LRRHPRRRRILLVCVGNHIQRPPDTEEASIAKNDPRSDRESCSRGTKRREPGGGRIT
jgi:hypothetical protein